MKKAHKHFYCFLAFIAFAGVLSADEKEFTFTQVWLGNVDLDEGGEFGSSHTSIKTGLDWNLGRGEAIGFSLGATKRDYDFSGDNTLFTERPWSDVTEYNIGMSWRKPVGQAGMVFLAPSIQFARGDGADWGESWKTGAILSYSRVYSDNLTLGFGMGIYSGLEETQAFPVLFINWQINESWRLSNPFRPGPSGPAGLELAYALRSGMEIGFGVAWRSERFRLDENGPFANGIGELEGVPSFLRLTWQANEAVSVDLYGGMFLFGEVTVENEAGELINRDDMDSASIGGVSISAAF